MTVGELDAYIAGLKAGYWSRIGEENERWRDESSWRPDLPRHERASFRVGGEWVKPWTSQERKEDREATLRDGHAAGLHEARWPVLGCPVCAVPVKPVAVHVYVWDDCKTLCGETGLDPDLLETDDFGRVTCETCNGKLAELAS